MTVSERPMRRWPALEGWRGMAAAALIGIGIGLGQVPFALPWIAFPALILAVALFRATRTPRLAFRRGWALGAGYAVLVLFWIVEPFLVDIARHGWMAPFALVLLAGGFGLFWGAAFWLARWLAPAGGILLLPLTWTAAEMLRSYALTGFPWALVSYIWTETPLLQLSAQIGPHGLTLLTLAFAAATVAAWASRYRTAALAGLVVAGAVLVWAGHVRQQAPIPGSAETGPVIRLVQPNADQKQKWDPAMIPVFYNRQLALTAEQATPPPDLVIWPEVSVPFLLNDPDAPLWEIAGAAESGRVILGGQRLIDDRAYNSLAVLDRDGAITQVYDKAHLVPFGEYLPLSGLMNRLGLAPLASRFGLGYSAGDLSQVLDLGPMGRALPLICYESIFPHEMHVADRPDWLLLVTNDAWFGKVSGPYQHFAQARARTVELGLPMVRVANTGISAMIDAKGRVIDSLPLGVAGRLDVALPPPLPATLYSRTGDSPVLLLLALGLAIAGIRRIRLTLR